MKTSSASAVSPPAAPSPEPRRARRKRLGQRLLALGLFLIVLAFVGALSWRYRTSVDWTYAGRNSLSEASRQQLARMPGPIAVTVFMSPDADTRKTITRWFERYQRVAGPRLSLRFIDPQANPAMVRQYEVSQPEGQLFIEYRKRRESLSALNEDTITSALQRLSYSGTRQVVFLAGQGEPAVADDNERGVSSFADSLRDKGLKVSSLNPAAGGAKIPADTALLVVGPAAGARLAGIDKMVDDYVAAGGNLLWLADTGTPPGLDALAARLGVAWQEGYVVFPQFMQLGTGHPGNYVASQFPPNEVTKGFAEYAIFPLARPFAVAPKPEWNPETLLQTGPDSWVDTATNDSMDEDGRARARVSVFGETFSRQVPGAGTGASGQGPGRQRVAVIGDAGFLENGSIDALGNRALAERLALWLTGRDADIGIAAPKAPDAVLLLTLPKLLGYAAGFAVVLPLALLAFGLIRRRRRQRR